MFESKRYNRREFMPQKSRLKSSQIPLKLSKLTKHYGNFIALESLDLTVNPGEIFGFLGPNGAGKSTTIRTIMNFQSPTSGHATIFGLDSVKDSVAAKERVGYLSGELAVYEDLTGRKFLQYLGSFNPNFDWSQAELLAERFQAELDRKLKELSKGNRQKIGLIQAFMHSPDLLILDEPTSGLDPLMQEEFFRLLEDCKNRGASVFFSSHNIDEVQRAADRACFIRGGRLISVEDVKRLRGMDVHRLQVRFGGNAPEETDMSKTKNVEEAHIKDKVGLFVISGSVDGFIKKLAQFEVLSIDREETSLEDIFLRFYKLPEENHEN